MKIRIIARCLGLEATKFECMIYIPSAAAYAWRGRCIDGKERGVELGTVVESDKLVPPGQEVLVEFEWPFPSFRPTGCHFKATPETSLKFQLLVFECDGSPLIVGSGTPAGPGERMFA